jgi:hypothetical protein
MSRRSAFFFEKGVGLEEENEIRTTVLVVIDRRRMLEQEDAFDH